MIWRLLLLGLLLWSSCCVHAKKNSKDDQVFNDLIDIDAQNEGSDSEESSGKGPVDTFEDMEGSGVDDEELGSGDRGSGVEPETTTVTTKKLLTPCQQLRQSSEHLRSYVPQCTADGRYQKRQCQGQPGYQECWCVDPSGIEIPRTMMNAPDEPDCKHGVNLKECVFQFLQHSHGLFGEYRPHCTLTGEFEKIQCHERECWCVNMYGKEIIGSRTRATGKGFSACEETTSKPTAAPTPVIMEKTTKKHTHEHHEKDKTKETRKGYDVKKTDKVDDVTLILPDDGEKPKIQGEDPIEELYDDKQFVDPEAHSAVHIMKQPGLLAAIIGGAVVGLLCAILLVMFIVYRMRKKDEGSYALDEPHQKYQNYSYSKAPDKEFYA